MDQSDRLFFSALIKWLSASLEIFISDRFECGAELDAVACRIQADVLVFAATCDEVKLIIRIAVVVKPRCAIGRSDPIKRTVFGLLRIVFDSTLDKDSPTVFALPR